MRELRSEFYSALDAEDWQRLDEIAGELGREEAFLLLELEAELRSLRQPPLTPSILHELHRDSAKRIAREVLEGLRNEQKQQKVKIPFFWPTVSAALLFISLGLLIFLHQRALPKPSHFVQLASDFELRDSQGQLRKQRKLLYNGDRIKLDKSGHMTLIHKTKARLQLNGPLQLSLYTKHVQVSRGHLSVQVPPQKHSRIFRIDTPHGNVQVTGTAYELDVTEDNTLTQVHSGQVRINALNGNSLLIEKGEYSSLSTSGKLSPIETTLFEEDFSKGFNSRRRGQYGDWRQVQGLESSGYLLPRRIRKADLIASSYHFSSVSDRFFETIPGDVLYIRCRPLTECEMIIFLHDRGRIEGKHKGISYKMRFTRDQLGLWQNIRIPIELFNWSNFKEGEERILPVRTWSLFFPDEIGEQLHLSKLCFTRPHIGEQP